MPEKSNLSLKVSEKGAVSLYGVRSKFPVTFYAGEWKSILGERKLIEAFIEKNVKKLTVKTSENGKGKSKNGKSKVSEAVQVILDASKFEKSEGKLVVEGRKAYIKVGKEKAVKITGITKEEGFSIRLYADALPKGLEKKSWKESDGKLKFTGKGDAGADLKVFLKNFGEEPEEEGEDEDEDKE